MRSGRAPTPSKGRKGSRAAGGGDHPVVSRTRHRISRANNRGALAGSSNRDRASHRTEIVSNSHASRAGSAPRTKTSKGSPGAGDSKGNQSATSRDPVLVNNIIRSRTSTGS